jgi:hypothetical protein
MITLEFLKDLGHDATEICDGVYQISNFVSEQELQELYSEVASYSEDDWRVRYLAEMRSNSLRKFGRDDIDNLVREGLLEITQSWEDKNVAVQNEELKEILHARATEIFDAENLEVSGFLVYQRLYEGTQLVAHFDQYSDKLVQYAAVLYLNDDYAAGEIFFPKLDLKLKPPPGALLIFPGTKKYEHGVHPVEAGPVRYVIPDFIKEKHPDGDMAGWANFG